MTTHPTDETPGTPRTDAHLKECLSDNRFRIEHMADFARTLEKELNEELRWAKANEEYLAILEDISGSATLAEAKHLFAMRHPDLAALTPKSPTP